MRPLSSAVPALHLGPLVRGDRGPRRASHPEDVLRFDGNTQPDPPATARPETVAAALERIQSYRHGGFPELLAAIADYNGVEPENVVLGAGADDLLMLCARSYAGPGDRDRDRGRAVVPALPRRRVGHRRGASATTGRC